MISSSDPSSEAKGRLVIERLIKTLPDKPGVYRMLDEKGQVLYVGKAKNLKKRVVTYTQPDRLPLRLQRMISETCRMEIVTTYTEAEALLLEANLIKKLMPRYNILFRDGKTLAYIALTRHEWPLLTKYRGKQQDNVQYFGPFASVDAVTTTLTALHRAFLLRSCPDTVFKTRQRPCLQYHIKRCSAPCVGKITVQAYQELVRQAIDFLNGKSQDIQKALADEMSAASLQQSYEKAAVLRDRIRALTQIQAHQLIYTTHLKDADIVALIQEGGRSCVQMFFFRKGSNYGTQALFPKHDSCVKAPEILQAFLGQFYADVPPPPLLLLSHSIPEANILAEALKTVIQIPKQGPKKLLMDHALSNAQNALSWHLAQNESQLKILEKLTAVFDLPQLPKRIEVYDNSHLQGTNAVGAMIVAGPEGFIKKAYRKFTIKGDASPGDDFGMMREVLTRRFKKALEKETEQEVASHDESWPDLVIIDGGKGQLSAAQTVFDDLGISDIALVAMAKGPQRNAGHETFYRTNLPPLQLDFKDPVLYYLQRLRDESHRYVINVHRQKRGKGLMSSRLEEIPGVGASRKKALLQHFGSLEAIKQAGIEDLRKAEGISLFLAQKIYEAFREK